ncbi:hypothetical protein JCM11491_002587 [Sporobolomyces phaffii]
MNQIQQIQRINQQELDSGATASWHDQYKDSAYINVGGLPFNLTEGDVLAVFSQYGEILDINLPRDAQTGKVRGFAWLMYADQRSTILAVDNLNGATILGRMIRVDHTLNYKQLEHDAETGKMKEREHESFAADPRKFVQRADDDGRGSDAESDASVPPNFDPEDPMAEYILSQHRQAKKRRRIDAGDGTARDKDERRKRKEERRLKREERDRKKAAAGGSRRHDERDGEGSSRRKHDDGDEAGLDRRQRGTSQRERERSRSPDRRRRVDDDYDRDRVRDDRRRGNDRDDRDRSERRNTRPDDRDDYRRESRGTSGGPSRGSAFADLEKWARR